MKQETVWVEGMRRWVPTGHVKGTSRVERELVWWDAVVAEIRVHARALIAERERAHKTRAPMPAQRALHRRYGKAVTMLADAENAYRSCRSRITVAASQRRALFLQKLIETPTYLTVAASKRLIDAKIDELNMLTRYHIAKAER